MRRERVRDTLIIGNRESPERVREREILIIEKREILSRAVVWGILNDPLYSTAWRVVAFS